MTTRPRKRDRFRALLTSSSSQSLETNSATRSGLQLRPTPSTHSTPGPPISGSILPSVSPPPSASQQGQLVDSKPTSAQRRGSSTQSTHSASSLPSRDLWREALQRLSEKDRALVLKHFSPGSTDTTSIVDVLLITAKDKRKVCEDNRWNFQFKGHTVRLQDTADKVIVWLDKFKEVGDIAVNVDPMHAGLPWAGIRFLLQAAVLERQQMGALLLGLDRALYIIDRCKVYEILYPRDPGVGKAGDNFESALIELYVLILQFLSKAIHLYDKTTAARVLNAFWDPNDIVDFEKRCQDLEARVDIEAENCERSYNKIKRAASSQHAKTLTGLLEELKELKHPIGRIDTGVAALWNRSNEFERSKILRWASELPYEDHHKAASKGRTRDTGGWLFEHDQYHAWESSDEPMILWLHGIPGAGKTKLVSRIIDHFANRPPEHALAYFYCNRNEDARRDPENILCSFVKQLSISPAGNAIQQSLVEVYKKKEGTGFASAKLTFEESKALLLKLVQTYSRTILVLDALDETHKQPRAELIDTFSYLINESPQLKIFISSRRDDDIKIQLARGANVGIEATDNENDIGKFVMDQIDQAQKHRRNPISPDLRQGIIQVLLDKSQGMFQWAALQVAQLLSLERERDIRKRLGKLPKDLKDAYNEIYATIRKAEGSKPETAVRAFQWVMCSCEPLSAEVLVAAVCQDPEEDRTQAIDIDIHFVLDACSNLLVVDPQLGVCRFSHLSVQEYFEDHWDTNQTNGTVAKVCLSLLNDAGNWERGIHSDKASQDPEKTNQVDPLAKLLDYARRFWPIHIQNHGETNIDSRLSTLLKKFLGSINESGPAYKSWYKMYTKLDPSLRRNTLSGYNHDIVSPSYLASLGICLFGFSNVLAEWWEAGSIDPEQRNCQGHSLLVLAVLGSSSSVVKTLVKLGADVNAQLSAVMYGSALTAAAAAAKGNQNIVRLLLESGADVNAQLSGGRYGSALVAAVAEGWGNKDTVRLLLESGADANAQLSGGDYGSALVAATARLWGDQDMVRLLLESGADANAQLSGGPYGSALAAAAGWGNEDIVRLLLESGADVNVQLSGRVYGSVLAVAAGIWGDRNMVRLLLESGADVNAQLSGGRYGSALAAAAAVAAAQRDNRGVVRLLLESGADANEQLSGGAYGSALAAAAAQEGNRDMVRLLLESGADVNAQLSGGRYGSALAAAVRGGNQDMVRLLLESGADVNAQLSGGRYGSALAAAAAAAAAERGNRDIVRLLLESGADINAQLSGERYGSALVAAVRRGDQDMVQLLLESGADVNAQLSGGRYASALAAATTRDNQDIVQVLLEYGIVQEKSSPNPPA